MFGTARAHPLPRLRTNASAVFTAALLSVALALATGARVSSYLDDEAQSLTDHAAVSTVDVSGHGAAITNVSAGQDAASTADVMGQGAVIANADAAHDAASTVDVMDHGAVIENVDAAHDAASTVDLMGHGAVITNASAAHDAALTVDVSGHGAVIANVSAGHDTASTVDLSGHGAVIANVSADHEVASTVDVMGHGAVSANETAVAKATSHDAVRQASSHVSRARATLTSALASAVHRGGHGNYTAGILLSFMVSLIVGCWCLLAYPGGSLRSSRRHRTKVLRSPEQSLGKSVMFASSGSGDGDTDQESVSVTKILRRSFASFHGRLKGQKDSQKPIFKSTADSSGSGEGS